MEYGILIDGALNLAPKKIILNDMQIFNPTAEQLIQAGYKEIENTAMPDDPTPDGQHYESFYVDVGDKITQLWQLVDNPAVEESLIVEDRVAKLEGLIQNAQAAIERGLTL